MGYLWLQTEKEKLVFGRANQRLSELKINHPLRWPLNFPCETTPRSELMSEQRDCIVLQEEIDPNYEPTEQEIIEYAKWVGMDLEAEKDLFWIAREGLKAALPEDWKPCKAKDTEEIFYFNFSTGESTWDHPCDSYYRDLYEEHKKKARFLRMSDIFTSCVASSHDSRC